MVKCSFCSEIQNEEENNLFLSIIKPSINIKTRIIIETGNWVVMPTIGALVPGYMLIVSKKHYTSVGHCPHSYLREFNDLLKSLEVVIAEKYNMPIVAFEHGSYSSTNRGGCCVEHAHVHVVPFCGDLMEGAVDKDVFMIKPISCLNELQDQIKNCNSYLFYQDNSGSKYIICGEYIQSQFFRQIIAQKLGLQKYWDWRNNFGLENIEKTYEQIKSNELQRIYINTSNMSANIGGVACEKK